MHTGDKYKLDYYKNLVNENCKTDRENIVFMTDLSIQPYLDVVAFQKWLEELGIKFYWIDHHKAALDTLAGYKIPGFQSVKKSGCWLTWYFLHHEVCNDGDIDYITPPLIVQKVSDYDIWDLHSKFNWETELLPLTYYLETFGFDISVNNSYLTKLLKQCLSTDKFVSTCEQSGKVIYEWVKRQYLNNARKMYEYEWNDYNCLVINSSFKGSKQFEVTNYDLSSYDLLVAWSFNGTKFEYCVYTKKNTIDCGMICKMFLNGGGHPGAAGGNSKKFIFGKIKL